jgi:predicted regulator of Ras-like GTPase activity (Roadblock/LC7/MglB family)
LKIDLNPLARLVGFSGAAVVDCETGLVLGRAMAGSERLEAGASSAVDVMQSARRLAATLQAESDVEDVIVSLKGHYHMARIVELNPAIIIYLCLDRRGANFGLALLTLRQVERAVSI